MATQAPTTRKTKTQQKMTLSRWTRVFSLRVLLLCVFIGTKIASMAVTADLTLRFGDSKLVATMLYSMLATGISVYSAVLWAKTWPGRAAFKIGVPQEWKQFFLLASCVVSVETFFSGVIGLSTEFSSCSCALAQMILHGTVLISMQMIAVDVYCDRRTNTFLFDTVTAKSEEKASDGEDDLYDRQQIELQELLAEK